MRFNEYEIITRAVEEGVRRGLARACKHQEVRLPDDAAPVQNEVERAVMDALSETVIFERPEDQNAVADLLEHIARALERLGG